MISCKIRNGGTLKLIRNYFADLELDFAASLDEVRKSYKRLARRFHPDLNPLDAQAEESFLRIQEAFDHLNSVTRIERLKKQLKDIPKEKLKKNLDRWGNYPTVPVSAEQFVSQWEDEPSINRSQKRPTENLDLWISLELKNQELKDGAAKKLKLQYDKPCGQCRGTGGRARSVRATCKPCAGIGYLLIERGAMHWKKTCDDCFGKGYVVAAPCSGCSGKGKVLAEELVELRISKNSDLSKALSFRGLGNVSYDGKKRGDVWVQLVQKQ
ncbi:MAG: molecular chaperone DnaJ [Bacteriovoracaceae bacterium]|nr:molecular chaperone DnaJ [Bacteriovoracaceae bacterium]